MKLGAKIEDKIVTPGELALDNDWNNGGIEVRRAIVDQLIMEIKESGEKVITGRRESRDDGREVLAR